MKKICFKLLLSLILMVPFFVSAEQYDYYVDCRYINADPWEVEYNPSSGQRCIPGDAFVIGTYLYDSITYLKPSNVVVAYQSIYNRDFFDVYNKGDDGEWYTQFGNTDYGQPYYNTDGVTDETVCITHVNNVKLPNATCPEAGSGGGSTPSGETVDVRFYYVNDSGQIQQIGGKKTIDKDSYLNVATVPDTVNYMKRGYRIDGWFNVPDVNAYSDSLANNKFNFGAKVQTNLNLFIRYIPISYKITYDFNGGNINGATSYENNSVTCNPSDQFHNNCVTNSVSPTRDGYTFKGWGIEKDGNTSQVLVGANENVYDIIVPVVSGETNITLYAIWELYNYRITYYLNGGDLLTGQLNAYFNVENSVSFTNSTTNPTRRGYSFAGWYADSDLTQSISSTAGRTSNISVYAKWTPKSTTIRYYENGTNIPSGTQACVYDNCTVDRNNPTKAGYEFLYWLGGDGQRYNKGEKVVSTDNYLSLTAQFNDGNYYDIEYDMVEGSIIGSSSVSKYQYSPNVTVSLPTPSKPGYSFKKWKIADGSVGNGTITNKTTLTVTRSGNITVEPEFEPLSYTVTYKYYRNNVLRTDTKTCTYDSCSAPEVADLYNGLPIKYWNGNDSKQYTPGGPIVHLENDLVLEAVYDSVSGYNIKFYDGNEQLSGFISRYSSDYAIHLPTISKTGYRFVGWKDKGQVADEPNYGTFFNIGTHGDKELEAVWTPVKVTVKYDLNYPGATNPADKECYLYNAQCTIGETPAARSGYEFLGWSLNDSTSQLLTASSNLYSMLSGASVVRLHAIWRPVEYSVIYDLNGGEFADADLDDNTYFVNLDNKNIGMKVPSREGYTFEQWSPENATVADNTHATMTAAGDVKLSALWNPETLTVVFKNGNTTVNGSVSSTCNYEGCTINTDNPSRDGYVFKYWKTEDGRYIFNKGDSIVGFYGTLTLHAVFNDEDTNSITYDLDEGSFGDLNPIEEYVTGVGANLPVPTKEGFTFTGWAKVVNGNPSNDLITEIPNTATGDFSLKAVYSKNNYTVKIISHLGTQNNNVEFNSSFTMPAAPNPPDVYHSFAGWREAVPNGGVVNPGTNVLVTSNRTYYAVWNVTTKFSIGYVLDGGKFGIGVDHPYSYEASHANIHIGNPEKDGYRFSGWRETNNYATINSSGILTVDTKADLEFKASWTQTRFNITYNYDGGTVASANPSTFTLDDRNSATVQLTAPTKDGYAFEGWTVEGANASVRGNTISIVPRANTPQTDLVVTATWRQVRYNITYDYAGGSITGTNPSTYEYNNGIGDIVLVAPTKEYYDFARWESSVDNISVGSNGVMRLDGQPSDVKFTAVYTPKEYTITFVDNTSRPSVTYGTQTCEFGTLCDIEMAAPSKEDRDFKYWKSSIGTIYPADGKIFAVSDMELEAEWSSPYTYSITYNLNHGEFIGDVVREYNHGESVTLPTADVIDREGYSFLKWNESNSCDGDPITAITNGTEDKEFYACYTPNTYEITYYTDDTLTDVYEGNTGQYAHGTSVTVPNYVSTDLDKVFIHWKGSNNRIYLPGETMIVSESINLYPEFYTIVHDEPLATHSITYNFNGGNDLISGSLVGRYTEGDTFELGTITRDGFAFAGWYDEGNNLVTSVAGQTTDLVLHAEWTASTYTINFYVGSELVETKTLNHGESYAKHHYLDAQSADATAINADTGEEAYYFASGWAYYGSNEVVFPYEYDFGELITSNPVVNLSAVIDPDEEFVNVDMSGYFEDQEGNIHFAGIGTVGLFKYDTQIIALNANLDEGWYKDNEFQYPINSQSTLNATNFDLQLAVTDPEFPQLKYYTEIFNLEYLEVTEYHVSFSVDGVADYGDFECSYDDEYCDLSSVQTPTKEGFEFLGWQSNVPGVTFNEHLVYNSLEHIYIDFTPIWGISNYTINFYDGETLIESMTYTYGAQNNMGSVIQVERGAVEDPETYFIDGWATEADSSEIAYDLYYDFTHFVTTVASVNLYAVIDPNADYVEIAWGISDVNQDGISYHTGIGSASFFKYGEEVDFTRIDNRTWYSDAGYLNDIENGLSLDEYNYPFIESCSEDNYPQVTKCGYIYGRNVVESLSSYTINFYDTDNETIKKTVSITYGDDTPYYGIDNSLAEVNGISGWGLYPDDQMYLYEYDYLYDFTKVATLEEDVDLYPIANPSDALVDVTYHIYYSYPDDTVSVDEQGTGHFQLRYNEMVNKDLLDAYFGADALYYKISNVGADNYQIDFTQPLDSGSWYLSPSVNQDYPNVRYTADVYVKVPMEDSFGVHLTGFRNYNNSTDGTLELKMFKGQYINQDITIPRTGNGNPHKISEYTWYLDQAQTSPVNLGSLPITEDLELFGYR